MASHPFTFMIGSSRNRGISDAFWRMLVASAKLTGETIAKELNLTTTASRSLDVTGGHGIFSAIFCQHYPGLQATILDSPVALETARDLVKQHPLTQRVELIEDDLWQADWGGDCDCVLLFNILHHFDLETNMKLLQLAGQARKPGGR